jgi:uncharacterized protein YecE (DUF72 family)
MGEIRIGVSGWRYEGWRGEFYPDDLAQRRELEYASRAFRTLEINGSFYSLQSPRSYAAWYRDTPGDFMFTVKGGRYVTHVRRLRDVAGPLANFFASGVFNLREKLGPFLWQFPPNFRYQPELMEAFLELLPRDLEAARALARRRDDWMKGRAALAIGENRRLQHAVEIRNATFLNESFVAMLRRHDVALVMSDSAGKWPYCEDVTSDFVYLRLHGEGEIYSGQYSDAAIEHWARRIRAWAEGREPADAQRIASKAARKRRSRDVYCYFDNDAKVKAPADARRLMARLGIAWNPAPLAATA